eukprot:scaffold63564_cov51-Phaeocystis_antarctica.AAC.1
MAMSSDGASSDGNVEVELRLEAQQVRLGARRVGQAAWLGLGLGLGLGPGLRVRVGARAGARVKARVRSACGAPSLEKSTCAELRPEGSGSGLGLRVRVSGSGSGLGLGSDLPAADLGVACAHDTKAHAHA